MYASSLLCRAENLFNIEYPFNSAGFVWQNLLPSVHLGFVFWKEAETQIQSHTMSHLPVAIHSDAGLARAMLGGNPYFQNDVKFPPSTPSTPHHPSTGLSG